MKANYLLPILLLVIASTACNKTTTVIETETIEESEIGVYNIQYANEKANAKFLFENTEPESVSFDANQRSFSTLQPLQLALSQDSLKIKFYSPRTIKNVTIYGSTVGYPQKIILATIDSIPAFADLSILLPGLGEERIYKTIDGKLVSIPGLSSGDVGVSADSDDAYFLKLKQIKIEWICSFSPYSRQGSWQYPILPPHMKEAVAIALNLTYMFGSQDYRDSLLGPWKGRFYGNRGVTDTINNEQLLNNILARRNIYFGHVSGVGGLGGGGTFGLAQYQYIEHYADDKSHQETMIHEFGHNLGYDHTSSMTYGNWWTYGAQMYERMSVNKELPVYSRQFLRTRANTMIYGYDPNNINYPSKYPISGLAKPTVPTALTINSSLICTDLK